MLEKINLGKQEADLCTSTLSQLMVQAYFEQGDWRDYVESLTEIYRARRDAMLDALAEHFPPQAEWTRPGGGLFIWATLPDFIDTTDLLARALRDNVAFVPGAGAFLDGRGHNSMRLNFSGSDEDEIREGIRRIGEVIKEQVALYGTLTGESRPSAPRSGVARSPTTPRRGARSCCRCRAERTARRAGGAVSRVAVLKGGRSLERQVSLRSGARVEDALGAARPRGGARRRRPRPDPAAARRAPRRGLRRPARPRRRGRHRAGAARDPRHPLHGLGRAGVLAGDGQGARPSTCCSRPGIPTPEFFAFNQTAFRELGAADALPAIEERLDFPIVVKPSSQGSALGIKFAAHRGRRARRAGGRVLLRRAVLLERHVEGRDLAVSVLEARRPRRCRWWRRCPREEDFYDFEARYDIGRTDFVCPAELPAASPSGPRSWRWPPTSCSACYGFGRVDLMLDADGELFVLEANPIPGLTETSLLPQAAEAAGIGFDELVERILELAFEPAARSRPRAASSSSPDVRLAAEVLGRDVVEEVLELLDDLLRVLDLVLELDRGLGDHVLGGEDRGAGAHRQGQRVGGARVDLHLAAVHRRVIGA